MRFNKKCLLCTKAYIYDNEIDELYHHDFCSETCWDSYFLKYKIGIRPVKFRDLLPIEEDVPSIIKNYQHRSRINNLDVIDVMRRLNEGLDSN